MTQEEVAERLGIGNEAVSRIERGVVNSSWNGSKVWARVCKSI